MKKSNAFLSLLLIVCMVLSLTVPAFASENTTSVLASSNDINRNVSTEFTADQSNAYDALCNELTFLYAKLNAELDLSTRNSLFTNQDSIKSIQTEIEKINEQLDAMGSRTLTSEEISKLAIASNKMQTYGAIDVADTEYATVRATNLLTTTSGGKTYKYCIVTAIPTSDRSNLANDCILYENTAGNQAIKYLFEFFAQATVTGAVPILSWIPFDLFSLNNNSVTNVGSYTIDARVRTTAKYYFIVEAGKENFLDSSQFLIHETGNIYSRHNMFNNITNEYYPAEDINYYYTADLGGRATALEVAIQNYKASTSSTLRLTDFNISAEDPNTGRVIYTLSVAPAQAPTWIGNIS